jgi:hypothetical protein
MRNNYKISVALHTASQNDLLSHYGIPSHLQWFCDTLNRQTFKDFEFIIVDYFYPEKKEIVKNLKANFPIKYIPNVRRYWQDMGYISISASKNSTILFSEGELIIQLDDAETFNDDLLQVYWDYYKNGALFHPVHKRYPPQNPPEEEKLILSIKEQEIFPGEGIFHQNGGSLYAGTSFSIQDGILTNGFNERMDGQKSLEDCEFGERLRRLNRVFVKNAKNLITIYRHAATYIKYYKVISEICNLGFIKCGTMFGLIDWTVPITSRYETIVIYETQAHEKRSLIKNYKTQYTYTDLWKKCPIIDIKLEREICLDKYYNNVYI